MSGRGGWQSRREGLGWTFAMLLLIPPLANLALEYRQRLSPPPAEEAGRTRAPAAVETATLRQQLWETERELTLLRGWSQAQPRYHPVFADVVYRGDLSPRRAVLWVWGSGFAAVDARTVAVDRGALLGRVRHVWPEQGVAQIQSLRDPYIRVRFRYDKAWGFLSGTGRADAQGRPLLEIRHLSRETTFQEGDQVFTDGEDGFFPKGILIGTLVRSASAGEPGGEFHVRGEFPPERAVEAILLVDRVRMEIESLAGKDPEK